MGKRTKIFGAIALILMTALVAVPWLVPASAWIPRVEEEASKRLGAPIKIGEIRVALLPLPHLSVHGLDVGRGAITAISIEVYPAMLSLLSGKRVLRTIDLAGVMVSRKGIDLIAGQIEKPGKADKADKAGATEKGGGGSAAAVEVERIRAKNIEIEWSGGKLPAFHADIDLNPSGAIPVESALITTVDGKAKLKLEPASDSSGREWKLLLEAADWQLPVGPALKFTSLKGAGKVTADKLVMNDIAGALYDGTLSGKVEVSWQKIWKLAGEAKIVGLDITPATQALKVKSALSGRLDASGPFSAQALKPAGLGDAFNADIGFKVNQGVLQGFDLASAAKNLLKGGGGGNTQFDELTGRLKVTGHAYKLSSVRVTSGVLKAEGNVDISAAKQLSGRIDTELKGTAGLVSVPLAVSGTLDHPILLPTKGSMLGAAVGTVLLPGVGTSVGSSVGDRIGKMFGK